MINCVCHSIRSMFRVLGIYNFGHRISLGILCRILSLDDRHERSKRRRRTVGPADKTDVELQTHWSFFARKSQKLSIFECQKDSRMFLVYLSWKWGQLWENRRNFVEKWLYAEMTQFSYQHGLLAPITELSKNINSLQKM